MTHPSHFTVATKAYSREHGKPVDVTLNVTIDWHKLGRALAHAANNKTQRATLADEAIVAIVEKVTPG